MIVLVRIVLRLLADLAGLIAMLPRSRRLVEAEILFLRRQLALYQERGVRARRVDAATRVSLAVLSRLFDWRDALVVVRPETLIRWHRVGWRLFWRVRSRPGRPRIPLELRLLIRRMATENPIWGEERIANELLLKLGLQVSPRTVRKYMPKRPPGRPRGDQRWSTFLRNHADAIVACDFFVAVTASFRLLYVFVVIEHGSRRLMRVAVTAHPSAAWTLQQLRDVVGLDHARRYLLHDRVSIFARSLDESIRNLGLAVLKSPPHSPKANAICERVIGTIRRECQIGAGWLASRISAGARAGVIGYLRSTSLSGCIRRSILTESGKRSAKTRGAMMKVQIAEARRPLATLSLALAIMLAGPAGTVVAQVAVLLPTDGDIKATLALPGDIQRGKEAYAECQTCHRQDGSGRPKFDIPRLSGQHASVLIKQLMDIRSGLRVNPEMQDYMLDSGFTLQDFADIAAYLQSLPVAGNIAQGPPELVPRGQALYASDCAACHGEHGEGRAELFYPMLASQHYSYLLREIDLILSGERGNSNPAMPAILRSLSADDKRAVAAYLAQLPAPGKTVTRESPR